MAENFDTAEKTGEMESNRIKRSEALLTQLYRDELNPRFRAPRVPGLKLMVFVSVLAIVLSSAILFYKFNSFILLREDVRTKAGNLESVIQRRANLFGNLSKLTLNHAALEHSIYSHAADMRTEIIKKIDIPDALKKGMAAGLGAGLPDGGAAPPPAGWEAALGALAGDGNMEASLGRLLGVVEQYPNVQSSETYRQMMTSLVDMEDRIAVRRVEYNTALREYNTSISKFPWYILAKITHFERFQYYAAGSKGTSAPVLSPEVFQQLVPLATGKEKKQ